MDARRNMYFFHQGQTALEEIKQQLQSAAKEKGFIVVNHFKEANIIVSIGGDGTFLQAVRKSGFRDDCLYVGISTGNETSFYSDFHFETLEQAIEAMDMKKIEVRRYPVLEVTIDDEGPFYCLNEFTIRSSIVKTFVLDVYIDDLHFETFRGDGMIISTPTGSTGYNKSVHGAIVDPLLRSFQVNELASINNNQFRTIDSPLILSSERKLRLEVHEKPNNFPIISFDNEALATSKVRHVEICLSQHVIKTVKLKTNSFWHKVKRTFL